MDRGPAVLATIKTALRRQECGLAEARRRGISEVETPAGVVPLPETVEEFEELKRGLFARFNRRAEVPHPSDPHRDVETDTLKPAQPGYLAVLGSDPFRVGLFWREGAHTQNIPVVNTG